MKENQSQIIWQHNRIAFYDLDASPTSYDITSFLVCVRGFSAKLHVVLVPGTEGGFKSDHKPINWRERQFRLHHIVIPAITSIGATYTLCETREQAQAFYSEGHFPPGYTIENRFHYHILKGPIRMAEQGVKFIAFRATGRARELMEKAYPVPPIVISMRECYVPERNSDVDAWLLFYHAVRKEFPVVFIRDTDKCFETFAAPTCQAAAVDYDLRLALMERAVVNMGVANGPLAMAVMGSHIPYLMFKMWNAAWPPSSTQLEKWGLKRGTQFKWCGPLQKIIWEADTFERILDEFRQWQTCLADVQRQQEKAA
jgi:hypothetical protein